MDGGEGGKRGNVRTITVAARKRLIKWHLAQRASAPRSWWRRERMGFDSGGRKDGREEASAAEERLQGCKGNRLGGTHNTGNVVYRAREEGGQLSVENGTQNQRCQSLLIWREGGGKDGGMLAWQMDASESEWVGVGLGEQEMSCHRTRFLFLMGYCIQYAHLQSLSFLYNKLPNPK